MLSVASSHDRDVDTLAQMSTVYTREPVHNFGCPPFRARPLCFIVYRELSRQCEELGGQNSSLLVHHRQSIDLANRFTSSLRSPSGLKHIRIAQKVRSEQP